MTTTTHTANGKAGDADILAVVPGLFKSGLPLLPCDGKRPIHDDWQNRSYTAQELSALLRGVREPMLGLRLGPGSVVDIEADSPAEEQLFAELFADCEIPVTPAYRSTRGKHRLFAWSEQFTGTQAGVVNYRGSNGVKLGIRIGADGKGAQSIIPPSPGREWLVGLDDCDPAPLPSLVIQRILAAACKRQRHPSGGQQSSSGLENSAALAAMRRIRPKGNEQDGSKRLYAVCCRAVEHDLTDAGSVAAVRHYEQQHSFPKSYTDEEILARVRDAEKQVVRGSEVVISNYITSHLTGENGETKAVTVPRSMRDIIADICQRMGDFPRSVDSMLFVDDPEHGLGYFDRRGSSALFGWLRRHCKVQWRKGGSFVAQAELFAELERTARRYRAIEILPHEPPIDGIYYRGKTPKAGDGSHLQKLLDFFRPETTTDRDLIQAAVMTVICGIPPGCRPAFVVTSDYGRGVGKTKIPETVGYLCGGHIDVSCGEDIESLKTRMLTPGARTIRIALLDNVKSLRLSWAELEALITSPIISGRQMYVGEGQRPNLITWFITLNGVSMATDMAQRSVIINVSKGKNAGTWWDSVTRFIDEHREQVIADIVAALRADPYPLPEFSRWATWEQQVLSRLPEPGEAQKLILERQGEANCEMEEAEIIEEHFAEQLDKLSYDPATAQVRIPVAVAARWYGWAVNESTKTASASKRLHQMAHEGQLRRITPDPSRTYGRCFIWTGVGADVIGSPILNDLQDRIAQHNPKGHKDA